MNALTPLLQPYVMGNDVVLDLGCGLCNPTRGLKCKELIGMDIFEPYLEKVRDCCSRVIAGDIRDVNKHFGPKSVDVILCLDTIEHLTKEEGWGLIEDVDGIARKVIIFFCPVGWVAQEDDAWGYNNPHQKHQSSWYPQDFQSRGYVIDYSYGYGQMMAIKLLSKSILEVHPIDYWDNVENLGCQRIMDKKSIVANLLSEELPNSVVLDLGCGEGRMAKLLKCKEYNGVDYSPGMIKRAKELNPEIADHFQVNDGKTIPFTDNTFDIVVCNTVVQHLTKENFKQYIQEVHRVLKTGGRFIVNIPKPDYEEEEVIKLFHDFSVVKQLAYDPEKLRPGHRSYHIMEAVK